MMKDEAASSVAPVDSIHIPAQDGTYPSVFPPASSSLHSIPRRTRKGKPGGGAGKRGAPAQAPQDSPGFDGGAQ